MTTLTRDDIFDQDRNEAFVYSVAASDDKITLPLTRLGFEALLKTICDAFDLPCDDASRAVIAGYIHHIPNEENTTTIDTLGRVLHKSVSNSTSWRIDQEIKIKRREAELAQMKADKETQTGATDQTPSILSVVSSSDPQESA